MLKFVSRPLASYDQIAFEVLEDFTATDLFEKVGNKKGHFQIAVKEAFGESVQLTHHPKGDAGKW